MIYLRWCLGIRIMNSFYFILLRRAAISFVNAIRFIKNSVILWLLLRASDDKFSSVLILWLLLRALDNKFSSVWRKKRPVAQGITACALFLCFVCNENGKQPRGDVRFSFVIQMPLFLEIEQRATRPFASRSGRIFVFCSVLSPKQSHFRSEWRSHGAFDHQFSFCLLDNSVTGGTDDAYLSWLAANCKEMTRQSPVPFVKNSPTRNSPITDL